MAASRERAALAYGLLPISVTKTLAGIKCGSTRLHGGRDITRPTSGSHHPARGVEKKSWPFAGNERREKANRLACTRFCLRRFIMSVSGISTNTNLNQTTSAQTKFRQIRNDFQQLGQALQSGDLNGAQQAFAALQQLIPNLSSGSQAQNGQQGSSQNPLLAGLNAVGKALQSGDLSGAKTAFAKLQQDVQSVSHKGHHHRKMGGSQNSVSSLTGNSSQTATSSSSSKSIGQNINVVT